MTTIGDDPKDLSGHHQHQPPAPRPDPVPKIHHGPPPPKVPHAWQAPHVHSHGGFEVHHDVLREVGAAMMGPDMYELDDALRQLRHSAQELGSLPQWSTGAGLAGNAHSARDGFLEAGGQVGDAHFSAARKLMDSVEAYEEAERDARRRAREASAHRGITSQHGHHGR